MTSPSLRELLTRGQRTEAEQQARRRLAQAPQDVEALATLASLQLERGSLSMARSTLAQAAAADRSRWELSWVGALLELSTAEPAAAQALLARLWREHPDKAEVGYTWGNFLANHGHAQEARAPLTRAVELAPDDGLYHFALATVLLELDETPAATEHLKHTLRLRPSHTATYTTLARLLMLEGREDEARRLLETALPVVEEPALVQGLLGSLRVSTGELSEGLELLEKALIAFPEHPGFNADKARVLLAQGRTRELLTFCEDLERAGRASSPTRIAQAQALAPTEPQRALELVPAGHRIGRLGLDRRQRGRAPGPAQPGRRGGAPRRAPPVRARPGAQPGPCRARLQPGADARAAGRDGSGAGVRPSGGGRRALGAPA